jgi:hypothetical protein
LNRITASEYSALEQHAGLGFAALPLQLDGVDQALAADRCFDHVPIPLRTRKCKKRCAMVPAHRKSEALKNVGKAALFR